MKQRISLLNLKDTSARKFFLEEKSYCNIELPPYFSFAKLLQKLSEALGEKALSDFCVPSRNSYSIRLLDDVHYTLYTNKDGNLSWRPLQLLHPLFYIALVHTITEKENWKKIKLRFKSFQKNPQISCLSIPVKAKNKQSNKAQQILQWWEEIEQKSITLSLDYQFIFDTDIADCYGSIYTHSIAWAIETKEVAKEKKQDKTLLGNIIDKSIQNAQYQQTNGIPQGSVLMDFVAEMVLGYIDELLTIKLKDHNITNYQILRYRDDYKIFVNSKNDGINILKILSELLMPFGLKLNSSKTKNSDDIIISSIKKDKLAWLELPDPIINKLNFQKHILLIKQHSLKFPNSGSLTVALSRFHKRLEKSKKKDIKLLSSQIISIVADIAYSNPKSISICCAIISFFSLILEQNQYNDIAIKVYKKLKNSPNSGFAQIWLQRMLIANNTLNFSENLCKLRIKGRQNDIWNHSWIQGTEIKNILENEPIINQDSIADLTEVIHSNEYDLFAYSRY